MELLGQIDLISDLIYFASSIIKKRSMMRGLRLCLVSYYLVHIFEHYLEQIPRRSLPERRRFARRGVWIAGILRVLAGSWNIGNTDMNTNGQCGAWGVSAYGLTSLVNRVLRSMPRHLVG